MEGARAAAAERASNQRNAVPTKKQRLAEIFLPECREYIVVAQNKELSFKKSNVGKLVTVPEFIFRTNCCNGLFIRQEYVDVANTIKENLTSDKSTRRVFVLGSPGIGKSVFGVLLFLLAIKEGKTLLTIR